MQEYPSRLKVAHDRYHFNCALAGTGLQPEIYFEAAASFIEVVDLSLWYTWLEDKAMSRYEYTIILHPDIDEGGYTVTVPALPGCVTQGETIEEAIAMAKDAIRLHVEALIAEGEPVPQEREHPQASVINVAA